LVQQRLLSCGALRLLVGVCLGESGQIVKLVGKRLLNGIDLSDIAQ
jgi:hypothetical protein